MCELKIFGSYSRDEKITMEFHIVNCIRAQIAARCEKNALGFYRDNRWQTLSWSQFGLQMDKVSHALLQLGLGVQESVAIFASNSEKWTIADLGILQTRAISVPIYPNNTAQQALYIINDAKVRVAFAGSLEQTRALVSVAPQAAMLHTVVCLDEQADLSVLKGQHESLQVLSWSEFLALANGAEQGLLAERLSGASMSDLFTFCYTSGTTGEPKGVMLDFANIAAQLHSHDQVLNIESHDVSLAFLPLAHIFERCWTFYVLYNGATNYYLGDPAAVRTALQEIKPSVMCAVPRFYEKIYSAVQTKLSGASWPQRKLFALAMSLAERSLAAKRAQRSAPWWQHKAARMADKIVLQKIRTLLGGNIRLMPCGGATLEPQIGRFFHALGVNVLLGYGMTETTATVSCWKGDDFDGNSIGRPMQDVQIKIGENDEILIKGPMVMRGYFNKPQESAQAFTADGFLKTGDAGYLNEKGELFITDRIKDLMKTSGGKYIAPQMIEGKLANDRFIEQIAVVADARHFVSALVVPCFEALESWAKELNIKYQDRLELVKHAEVIKMFETRIEQLQGELARFERVKRFTLLPKEFCMLQGELTPTLKLRRKVILERYQAQIDAMYQR
ncbi:MAG: AMP-dependent synthetase/ligase [Vibrionaceae bacterium]